MSNRKYWVLYRPVMAEDDEVLGSADTVGAARLLARIDMRDNQRIPEGYSYYERKPLFPKRR